MASVTVRFDHRLLFVLAACGGAAAPGWTAEPVAVQVAFQRFHGERVRMTVDGRIMFDRVVSVAPENVRLGLAAVARIDVPACSTIAVKTPRAQTARRICLTAGTRSIVVDAGPPLTIVAHDRFQGAD